MTLEELQNAVTELSIQEQTALLQTLLMSIQGHQSQGNDRRAIIEQLRGCLSPSGTERLSDSDVELLREERLVEKYL